MRKFLLKYMVGRYWWKLPDKKFWESTKYFKWMKWLSQSGYNVTFRFSFWCYNVWLAFALPALVLSAINGDPKDEYFSYFWVYFIIGALTLYFGFPLGGYAYFEKYPPRWEELDREQKWYYGAAANSRQLSKKLPLTDDQMVEWVILNNFFRKKYRLK